MDVVILVCFRKTCASSVRRDDPLGVGVEEQEENHADGHEVHIDEEQDAAVVEAPAALHAADGVDGAGDGEESGKDEKGIWPDVGKAGDGERDAETEKDEETATEQGADARIEKTGKHAVLKAFVLFILCSIRLVYLEAEGTAAGVVAGEVDGDDAGVVCGGRFLTAATGTSTEATRFEVRSRTPMRR